MEIIWGRFVEKTGGQKSRATVPLRRRGTDFEALVLITEREEK